MTNQLARYDAATALMLVDNLNLNPEDELIVRRFATGEITQEQAIDELKAEYARLQTVTIK